MLRRHLPLNRGLVLAPLCFAAGIGMLSGSPLWALATAILTVLALELVAIVGLSLGVLLGAPGLKERRLRDAFIAVNRGHS